MCKQIQTVWNGAKKVLRHIHGFFTDGYGFRATVKSHKKEEDPLLDVQVRGRVPEGVVSFFAWVGLLTALCVTLKILWKLR